MIEINFKAEATELLNHYGFNSFYTDVSKKKHKATISLLSVVARDAAKLKEKFTTMSLPVKVIDDVIKLAIDLPQAETSQEKLKTVSKPITEEQRKTLNGIYERAMDICKLGKVVFADNEIKKSRYIFKNLGGNAKRNGKNNQKPDNLEVSKN